MWDRWTREGDCYREKELGLGLVGLAALDYRNAGLLGVFSGLLRSGLRIQMDYINWKKFGGSLLD